MTTNLNGSTGPVQMATASSNTSPSKIACTSTLVSQGFRFAPPEVRQIIFQHTFDDREKRTFESTWRLPALFEALRGDQGLLLEASTAFFKSTTFEIPFHQTAKTNGFFLPLQAVQNLRFVVSPQILGKKLRLSAESPSVLASKVLSEAINVSNLMLYFYTDTYNKEENKDIFNRAARCFESFANLKKVSIKMETDRAITWDSFSGAANDYYEPRDFDDDDTEWMPFEEDNLYYTDVIAHIRDGFGTKGKVTRWWNLITKIELVQSVWEAKYGEVLVWKTPDVQVWEPPYGLCLPGPPYGMWATPKA